MTPTAVPVLTSSPVAVVAAARESTIPDPRNARIPVQSVSDPATAPISVATSATATTSAPTIPVSTVRYLRGSSSTKNDDHDRDHDHDHSRLLAVARIGQKPTMDKPNKYFNLFWSYLLISILGMSSYVVRTAGNPLDLPTWAGLDLTRTDIDELTIFQRKELITKYNHNKQTARVTQQKIPGSVKK